MPDKSNERGRKRPKNEKLRNKKVVKVSGNKVIFDNILIFQKIPFYLGRRIHIDEWKKRFLEDFHGIQILLRQKMFQSNRCQKAARNT